MDFIFTHYEIRQTDDGHAMIGRPQNPYPVTHFYYFEFEEFAKAREYWCTSNCKPGIFEKAFLRADPWDFDPEYQTKEDIAGLLSHLEIHKESGIGNDGKAYFNYFYYVYDFVDNPPRETKRFEFMAN